MKLTLIEAGEFMMGFDVSDPDAEDDEFVDKAAGRKDKHRVRITKPFYLGVTEVTHAWGLYDMHGNVREWCSDGYAADYYKQSPREDPPGASGASARVIRGGSWVFIPGDVRSATSVEMSGSNGPFMALSQGRFPCPERSRGCV